MRLCVPEYASKEHLPPRLRPCSHESDHFWDGIFFIRIHVDVVRYTPVFSVVAQRSSPQTIVAWRLQQTSVDAYGVFNRSGDQSGGFCDRIHWFRVDARPIRVRKYVVSKVSWFGGPSQV